jgi:hypothetical protein
MKNNEAAWRALRRPVSAREAAKLLGVSLEAIEQLVWSLDLMTVRVRGKDLIPVCELKRLHPSR